MATAAACRKAVDQLAAALNDLDPELRARHVPARSIVCRVKDLDLCFTARVDPDGVHEIVERPAGDRPGPSADVRVALASNDLIALAAGQDDVVTAWLHGRLQVSAPMRDILRLRSLLGL